MKAKPRKKEGQESLSGGPVPGTNVVRCLLQTQAVMADIGRQGTGGPLETVGTSLFCTSPFKKQIAKLRML